MANTEFGNFGTRVAVAIIAIPLILWVTMQGGYFFFTFVALISGFSLYEFYTLAEKKGAAPLKTVGIIAGFFINGVFIYERTQVEVFRFFETRGLHLSMFSQLQLLLVVELIVLLVIILIELFRRKGSPTINIATTVLGLFIISLFFGTLISVRELFPYGFPVYKFFETGIADELQLQQINRWGGFTVISLFATIWICDTAAYVGGVSFGKHKLFESVSPKKTWEGALFGLAFAILAMIFAKVLFLEYLRVQDAVVLGAMVGVFGQLGDLVESRFKRDAGVKDSSAIIPGHGGVFDRFDSLVFVSPFVYLYIDFVVLS